MASEIISARWIITVNENQDILEHHSLVLSGEKIEEILPTEEALKKYANLKHTNLSERHVLIPGLINMHTHTGMSLFRAISEGLSLQNWLENCIWPLEKEFVNEEFMRDAVMIGCYEMIRNGQTTYNDMYFFPEITAQVGEELGVRMCVGVPIIGFPTNWSSNGAEAIEKGRKLAEKYKGNERIHIAMAPHAPYTVSDDLFTDSLRAANELDIKIHTHLHETNFEVTSTDIRPFTRLSKLGVINDRLIAVHMTNLTEEEIEQLAKSGASVVHCPESNLKLGSGICNILALKNAGVNVALGTDGVASNDDLDLLGEMRSAALVNKYHTCVHKGSLHHALPSHYFIEMITINGAKALGIDHLVGSLVAGKKADITAIEILTEPVYSITNNIVHVGTNSVTDVWANGKQLLANKKVLVIDENQVKEKARYWGDKIRQRYNEVRISWVDA